MSRTALKHLNVWVTVPGEKEHPAWPYCPSFPLHLAKSQHQTETRTTAAIFSEMMCYDNFFFYSPSKFQMSDVASGWRCQTGAGTVTRKELHIHPCCWETNYMWRCNLCSRMTYSYHTQSQGNLWSLLQLKQKVFRNTLRPRDRQWHRVWRFMGETWSYLSGVSRLFSWFEEKLWSAQLLTPFWESVPPSFALHSVHFLVCGVLTCARRTGLQSSHPLQNHNCTFHIQLVSILAVSMAWAHHMGDRPSALFVFAGRNISSSM